MAHAYPDPLLLSDLNGVIEAVAKASSVRSPDAVRRIMDASDLTNASLPGSDPTPNALWTAAFTAALEGRPEALPKLLRNIRTNIGLEPWNAAVHALQEVQKSCITRCTLDAHPEVGDQADALLLASGPRQMLEAAKRLRETAISVRRLLLRPLLAGTFLQLQEDLGIPFPDPEWLRMEIADQAVDVVTSVDYLVFLLQTPPRSERLQLGGEPGSDWVQGRSDEAQDWLRRRQLDARGTAVRQGQRLLASLRAHIGTG